MFSAGSESSISFAIVTPSLVINGAPKERPITTLRPLGPSVTFTVSARMLTPRSMPRRASSSKCKLLPISTSQLLRECRELRELNIPRRYV